MSARTDVPQTGRKTSNVISKGAYVKDLCPGETAWGVFIVAEARLGQSRNGPYWNLTLKDSSGSIEGKIWSPLSQQFAELPQGGFVQVRGAVGTFRDRPQITVDQLAVLDPATPGLDVTQFLPSSAVPPEEMLEALEDLVTEVMEYKPWKKFCRRVLRDEEIKARLLAAPGAKTVHHAYVGGLLEHTLSVSRLSLSIAELYPEIDRQVLLAAAVFHDLGKAWELSGGVANDYTDTGRLLGHIHIALEVLAPFLARARDLDPELILHFKHIILSHHGEYEYGSPKRPKTPEAFVLHYADNLDAKLNTIAGCLEPLEGTEQTWTPFQRYLDRYLYKATPTPDGDRRRKNANPENQCLLPLRG